MLDVATQNMIPLSLVDPAWGSPSFYTKYVLRPSIKNGGGLTTPNGKCNSVGWNLQDIKRAIQFSGITLNQRTFQHTHNSLVAYQGLTRENKRELSGNQYKAESNLWRKLRRQVRKYQTGVGVLVNGLYRDRVWIPNIFGISGVRTQLSREVQDRITGNSFYGDVLPYQAISQYNVQLATPTRNQMTEYWNHNQHSRYFDFIIPGIPQLNLILTMVADCLSHRSEMATRIQTQIRSPLPSTQPQNEWQRLCGQIRNSEVDDNRLREIIVQRSQRNADPNRHLTMEGLAGLGKRRLCRLLVMQEMRDDRVKVQGIRKLMERHQARRAELEERYPEPPGICTNVDAPMDVVGNQVSDNLNQLCLIRG